MRRLAFVPILFLAAACSDGAAISGSPPTQRGDLGNGDFTFRCDDSVACERWSNSAAVFPDKIASGSIFDLNYFLKNDKGIIEIKINETPESRGYRLEPVPPYAGKATNGLTALKPGRATFVVRDGKGWVVDFTSIEVVKPEGLIVYDSEADSKSNPPHITNVAMNMTTDARKSFRVVAQHQFEPVAGAIPVQWTSSNRAVVDVEGYSRGKVTVVAKSLGTATLKANGAGIEESLSVEVK
jgi:hypothetical protein